jgi:hypothetical protein
VLLERVDPMNRVLNVSGADGEGLRRATSFAAIGRRSRATSGGLRPQCGYFGERRFDLTPNRRTTSAAEYDNFTVREFIAFAPLWQAYQKCRTEDGDRIPGTFSRHASVHGVSARQFSLRNSVQAVLF